MIKSLYAAALCATALQSTLGFQSSLPVGTQRRVTMSRTLKCQIPTNDNLNTPQVSEAPKPVATGGTDYTTLPKKEITPLFLIPSSSIVGRGDMVGDLGFDPLGLATSMSKLKNYREAELKHGRLAMLAAVGWPVAEELQGPLSKALGQPDLLVKGCATGGYQCAESLTRVPSVLNGGLDKISPFYWLAVIALSAGIEAYGLQIAKRDNYLPGDLGFDPLGLYASKNAAWKRDMQLKELNNGRLAMVAITGYAFNEAATKVSVVKSLNLPQ